MKKVNKKNFRKTLSKFSTGVTVIGINFNNINIGKTVNSFASLSLSPPLVLFSLDKSSSSLDKFKKSLYLSINVLSKNQKNISVNFAKKNIKWLNVDHFQGKLNTPIINNCLSNLECKVEKIISQGDHIIFICKVINILNNHKVKPLIYFDSSYI